jgi:glycosyltransferase involved in cell wall biosynthesis
MRILQLGKYYYPYMGGIENHLYLLCNELKSQAELEVVVCNTRARTESDMYEGVSVTRCCELLNVASTSLCPSMPLALSRRQYDILHFHFPHPMGVMSYLASLKPRAHRIVITYHSDIVRQERLLKLYSPFMRQVMDRAAAIICTSPNYIESSATLSAYKDKCRVIPYGIDLSQFVARREDEAEAANIRARYGGPLLIGVGRLIYYKGFEYAIQAMRLIKAQLLIVGDGPLRGSLEKLARDSGVSDQVHFLGEIDNRALMPYYYASDIFVFPSIARSEAFGIVQLEAMACSRAVVNTALDSGVPFVSRHEESGLTVEPKSPEALARAVNALLENREWMKRLGEAGRRRVETDFSKEVMTSRIVELYREVLTTKTQRHKDF